MFQQGPSEFDISKLNGLITQNAISTLTVCRHDLAMLRTRNIRDCWWIERLMIGTSIAAPAQILTAAPHVLSGDHGRVACPEMALMKSSKMQACMQSNTLA